MKTVDLPIGSHVARNSGSRSYPSFQEAYVIAHRPKGNKYSSWGYRTGNGDTVGIAYARTYLKDAQGRQIWEFDWVTPGSIEMTWDDYQATQKRIKDRENENEKKAKAALKARKSQAEQIPSSIRNLFSNYEWERLLERGETNTFRFSIERLTAIIEAAQAEVPETKAARIAAEVEAALQLL